MFRSACRFVSITFIISTVLLTMPVWAQGPQTRPVYSDKDKQKLAEIAQRPEVIQQIESVWESVRRQDMEFAFRVNTAVAFTDWRHDPQWLDVWMKYGRLYENPILANYVNSLGQRLVPNDSTHLYAFRVLLDPVPRAEALSTGTIYLSTGLMSLLDSEPQLAYVLAHEIAHIESNHTYEAIRNEILEDQLDKEREKSVQKKRAWLGIAAAVGGAMIGGKAGGVGGALTGMELGALGGWAGGLALFRNKFQPTQWDALHENEADQSGLAILLARGFDVRQVPPIYTRLAGLVSKDTRLGLGFIGDSGRVKERSAFVNSQLAGPLRDKLDAAPKTAPSPQFTALMGPLERDNGIVAMDYDLMPMAKENLEDAVRLRANDARAQYYLGKLYAMTGRTPAEAQQATAHLRSALESDDRRSSLAEPHLEYALQLLAQNNQQNGGEIQESLKRYVTMYQRSHAGELPANIQMIYDYLLMTGENSWYSPPVQMIAPRNDQPLPVTPLTPASAPSGKSPRSN